MQTFKFTQKQVDKILLLISLKTDINPELAVIGNTVEKIDDIYTYTITDTQLVYFADLLFESNDLDLITILVKQDRKNIIKPIEL